MATGQSVGRPTATEATYDRATASGSTTSRTLGARFADVVNVKDYGAKFDGVTNDSTAWQAAITAAAGRPLVAQAGTSLCNFTLSSSAQSVFGMGSGNVNTGAGATILVAADTTKPIITIGSESAIARGIRLRDFLLLGTPAQATNDGILIQGAANVVLDNVVVEGFGRDGISLQSVAQPTFAVHLIGCAISACRRSAFRAEYGTQYVTAVHLIGCHLNGWSLGTSHALYVDGSKLSLTDTYIDIPGDKLGFVAIVKTGSQNPQLNCKGVNFDNAGGASARAISCTGTANKLLPGTLRGNFVLNGTVEWPDATTFLGQGGPAGTGTSLAELQPHMYAPIAESIYFNDTGAGFYQGGTIATRIYQAASKLNLDGLALSPSNDARATQNGQVFQGSGVPNNANGNNGDIYFRTDTPGTANQRVYLKGASVSGQWGPIL